MGTKEELNAGKYDSYRNDLQKKLSRKRFRLPKDWIQYTYHSSILATCTKTRGNYVKLFINSNSNISVELTRNKKTEVFPANSVNEGFVLGQEQLDSFKH